MNILSMLKCEFNAISELFLFPVEGINELLNKWGLTDNEVGFAAFITLSFISKRILTNMLPHTYTLNIRHYNVYVCIIMWFANASR